jgi:ribosomal-protein-alanine N-acetyltransferase
MNKISLKDFDKFSNEELTELFKYVHKIDQQIIKKTDLEKFKEKTILWCRNTNSGFFGIEFKNTLVGTISLSKQNLKEKKANIGYEIFNKFRQQGFASKAFQLMLIIASNMNFLTVKSKIPKDNEASIKIWKKEGAIFKEFDHDKFDVSLNLNLLKKHNEYL